MARVSKKLDEFKSSPFKYIPFKRIKRLDVVNFINPNYPSLNSNSSNNYSGWSMDENILVNDKNRIAYSKIDKRRLTPGNWFFAVLSATTSSSKFSASASRIWLYYVFSKEEILSKVNEGIIKRSDYDKIITKGNDRVIYGSIPIFDSNISFFDKSKYHESDPRAKSLKRYLDKEIVFETIRLERRFSLLDSRWNSRMLHYHIPPYLGFNSDFNFINWPHEKPQGLI